MFLATILGTLGYGVDAVKRGVVFAVFDPQLRAQRLLADERRREREAREPEDEETDDDPDCPWSEFDIGESGA